MLRHSAEARPSSEALAASRHVPRCVPSRALLALLTQALAARGSRAHAQLLRALLAQRAHPADDLLYTAHADTTSLTPHHPPLHALVYAVVQVFRSHGAAELLPPLLTPMGEAWEARSDAVRVLTASGTVCHLPYDLRLPFARLVAHTGLRRARRYAVSRVFRELAPRTPHATLGTHSPAPAHPREALECAFDIISPNRGQNPNVFCPDDKVIFYVRQVL
ncbi:unnamed protein product [Parnassius apollo]|uniref:(apollo) hypothetical protein n=1 Tax=Parnassius apollo TaxID=110799 RepID=A0A8S3XLA4_PARAO|nr:unnamed protein product [Parnassius apollo]